MPVCYSSKLIFFFTLYTHFFPHSQIPMSILTFKPKQVPENDKLKSLGVYEQPKCGEYDPTNWRIFAVCPIAGFALRDSGLYDLEAKKVVTPDELRGFINEAAKIHARARATCDRDFFMYVRESIKDSAGFIFPGGWLYFGHRIRTKYLSAAWQRAFPANSLLFRFVRKVKDHPDRILSRLFFNPFLKASRLAHLTTSTPRETEAFCRRHRKYLMITNTSVMLYASTVIVSWVWGVTLYYWWRLPNQQMMKTQKTARFTIHSEHSLQWLYAVYYNHPAYVGESRDQRPRNKFQYGDG